ncbi:hypothetical protein PNEG_03436 [Pneumocystis murina B123]|uniref:Uncharacterized protein n=1 Tax=Pneumocystis murina (strain B123) TaxID=1069680 RepID=M7NMD5_PNEMU|nr:hypothetical protein PNEG_03436 [Pneumocystis murina B123]EMR08271.2 hypothetical protein PNEG_03436 [Pneumocystis murina B123]
MKIILFFLFTFITYVLSGTFGPLGFTELMPPYEPPSIELHFTDNLISGTYSFDDLLIFLTARNDHSCLQHLSNTCEELTKVYGDLSRIGNAVKSICEHQHEACQKLPEVKKELCNLDKVTYEKLKESSFTEEDQCYTTYTKCRFRSRGCFYEYMEQCRKLLYICRYIYSEYELHAYFINLLGNDFSSETFREKLKVTCRDLFDTSDLFVQLCFNPDSLLSDLSITDVFQKAGKLSFFFYSQWSTGALLNAQGLDGGLFLPRTDPSVNPAYFMGYLLGQHGFTSFVSDCVKISQKCLGLGFFPQSAYFCNAESNTHWDTTCKKTEVALLEQHVPNLKKELEYRLSDQQYPEGIFWSGINVNLCTKFLRPCSYLGKLDSTLNSLCDYLRGHCAYGLEIGSSLNIFEYQFRKANLREDSIHNLDLCQQALPQICTSILNKTVDFLAFCLKPSHTCFALMSLYLHRCDELKKGMTEIDLSEKECLIKLQKADTYGSMCPQSEEYLKFLTTCYTNYPQNQYLKNLAASRLKDLTSQEIESEKLDDDGF